MKNATPSTGVEARVLRSRHGTLQQSRVSADAPGIRPGADRVAVAAGLVLWRNGLVCFKIRANECAACRMSYRDIITIEPDKRGGKPCIRRMRITVYDVLGWLAAGMSVAEIIDDFPELTEADIRACLEFVGDR